MTKAQTERNADIYARHNAKETHRSIALLYGISEQRVSQIVGKMERDSDLPLTPMELALHEELHRLNEIEQQTIKRLLRLVNRRLSVHERLDKMLSDRARAQHRRSTDETPERGSFL